eukprot:15459955-Alexandrium_andersonii.AAC.1
MSRVQSAHFSEQHLPLSLGSGCGPRAAFVEQGSRLAVQVSEETSSERSFPTSRLMCVHGPALEQHFHTARAHL